MIPPLTQGNAMKDGSSSREKPGHQVGFTPGPWHFKPGNVPGFKTGSGNPGIYAQARQSDDHFILMIADLETNVPAREIEANALLIAAAPALYAALKAIIDYNDYEVPTSLLDKGEAALLSAKPSAPDPDISAREALSKARGEG